MRLGALKHMAEVVRAMARPSRIVVIGSSSSLSGDGLLPEWGGGHVVRAADDDARVFARAVEVIGDRSVDDGHAALVAV